MIKYTLISLLLIVVVFVSVKLILPRSDLMNVSAEWNKAEMRFLEKSGRQPIYAGEHIPSIETENVCELGKLTALTFIHWVNENPKGVIALPTGKTPELFIEYVKFYQSNWDDPKVQKDLKFFGIEGKAFPATEGLTFVQLDEFYPMDGSQKNSFTAYVREYYLNFLEIPPENVLSMDICREGIFEQFDKDALFPDGKVDLTLLNRQPLTEVEKWQKEALLQASQFCEGYEQRIEALGGIGFFMGGIGPDGHIAFNMQGSPHDSKTRLVQLNYPSAARAAGDLGGIEFSRDKTAITIGLKTITMNPDATIIIMAAGESKAPGIKEAVEKARSSEYPATVLHTVKGARMYLTKGAASLLEARRVEDVKKKSWTELSENEIDDIVMEQALSKNSRILDLTRSDLREDPRSRALMEKCPEELADLLEEVHNRLVSKIEKGITLPVEGNVLHTSPHHDDVMLSYHPLMKEMIENTNNYFVYLTSGFNSVTNGYILEMLNEFSEQSIESHEDDIFNASHDQALQAYLLAVARFNQPEMNRKEAILFLKNLSKIYQINDVAALNKRVRWLKEEYFPNHSPGEKDILEVQLLKGAMRETESERMLLLSGAQLPNIYHMRAKFYNGDYFNPLPSIEEDALSLLDLYNEVDPQLITVAFDPEGTGPDTHYKVLQVVAQALRMSSLDHPVKVWGYRNVWHRFKFSDGNLLFPVTEKEMAEMNFAFMSCFSTQRMASFPSDEHDGPFSELAEAIQREYYGNLQILLGEEFFIQHPNPRVRESKGFVFIKEMSQEEFSENAQELKSRIELI